MIEAGRVADANVAPELVGDFQLAADIFGERTSEIIASLTDAQRESICDHEAEARALVSSVVKLVDGASNEEALLTILRESTIGQIRGGTDGYVLAVYDLKASGEHSRRPSTKPPPLRRDHAEKALKICVTSRLSPDSSNEPYIHEGDMIAIFDGGRPLYQYPLQRGITGLQKASRMLHLVYSEDALVTRREHGSNVGKSSARGFMTVRQLENVMLVTAQDASKLGKRRNKHFEGSTTGDVLGPIGVPDLLSPLDTWRLTVRAKRSMMGTARTMGQSTARAGTGAAKSDIARDDQGVEPMNFDQMLPEVYSELLYRAGAIAVIDLTCSDGVLAAECIGLNLPYLGLCFSNEHACALSVRLASVVFRKFLTENSGIYKSSLASLLCHAAGSN